MVFSKCPACYRWVIAIITTQITLFFFLQEIITLIQNTACLTIEYILQHLQTGNGQLYFPRSTSNQVPATARSLTEIEGTGCHQAFKVFFPLLLLPWSQFLPHLFSLQKTFLAVTANTEKRNCQTVN